VIGKLIFDFFQFTHSGLQRQVENCSWSVRENHCQKICDKPDSCHIECADVDVTMYGRREIEFHYRTTHRTLAMDLLNIGNAALLASFNGDSHDVEQINDYVGACR
jgi:hypothetical protein